MCNIFKLSPTWSCVTVWWRGGCTWVWHLVGNVWHRRASDTRCHSASAPWGMLGRASFTQCHTVTLLQLEMGRARGGLPWRGHSSITVASHGSSFKSRESGRVVCLRLVPLLDAYFTWTANALTVRHNVTAISARWAILQFRWPPSWNWVFPGLSFCNMTGSFVRCEGGRIMKNDPRFVDGNVTVESW